MSVNIKVILLTAGRNTKPPTDGQWLRVTVRPGYVAEMRIRRRGGGCFHLDRRRQLLLIVVFASLRLSLRNQTRRMARVVQSLSIDLRRVLLLQLFQLLQLFHRLEDQTRHGRRYVLVTPRDRRMGDIVQTRQLNHQLRLVLVNRRIDGHGCFGIDVDRCFTLEYRGDQRWLCASGWQCCWYRYRRRGCTRYQGGHRRWFFAVCWQWRQRRQHHRYRCHHRARLRRTGRVHQRGLQTPQLFVREILLEFGLKKNERENRSRLAMRSIIFRDRWPKESMPYRFSGTMRGQTPIKQINSLQWQKTENRDQPTPSSFLLSLFFFSFSFTSVSMRLKRSTKRGIDR